MKHHLPAVLAHLMLALAMIFGGHALKNYYVLHNAIVPGIEAVTPAASSTLNELVLSALPSGPSGERAREVVKLREGDVVMLHSAWLQQAKAQRQLAAVQAVAWAVVLVTALSLMYLLRVQRQSAT